MRTIVVSSVRVLVAAFLFISFMPLSAYSAQPLRVTVGTYVNGIQDISFKDSKYVIDLYIWFRWTPEATLEDYKPLDSFEITNGRIDNKFSIVEKTIGNVKYVSARVLATISEPWRLKAFPFDRHLIAVHIEDGGHVLSEVVFEPDRDNSRVSDEVRISGWSLSGFKTSVADHIYASNYGDISLANDAQSAYSRFTMTMELNRDGIGFSLKVLWLVFLGTLVSFVSFLIRPVDLDPRFGLGIGALFAVAASQFIVSSLLPDSDVLSAADLIHMLAMIFIALTILQSAWSLRVAEGQRQDAAVRLDLICAIAFPIVFVLLCVAIIIFMT